MEGNQHIFSYEIPDIGIKTLTRIKGNKIVFFPPLNDQRYSMTIRIIEDFGLKQPFKKIVDFGCSKLMLSRLLRTIPFVENILEVDVDKETLQNYRRIPLPCYGHYLNSRERPLRIEILCGSISEPDEHLINTDIVIGLEILEHLTDDVLNKVPENVFSFIAPKIAIFSTPNVEFNVLFKALPPNRRRHKDHKFEWTRSEFSSWALGICERYPDYKVTFLGVGEPPETYETLGYCTQIALFVRKDVLNTELTELYNEKQRNEKKECVKSYESISIIDYPYEGDNI